jgi:hypothetical protein
MCRSFERRCGYWTLRPTQTTGLISHNTTYFPMTFALHLSAFSGPARGWQQTVCRHDVVLLSDFFLDGFSLFLHTYLSHG